MSYVSKLKMKIVAIVIMWPLKSSKRRYVCTKVLKFVARFCPQSVFTHLDPLDAAAAAT